jgi:hypothetical protein
MTYIKSYKHLNSDDFYMIDQNLKQLKSHRCNFIGQNFYNSGQHYGNLTLYWIIILLKYSLIIRKFLIVTCGHENYDASFVYTKKLLLKKVY